MPSDYERTEQGDDPSGPTRLTDEELRYLANWDCESAQVAGMATELLALRARVAQLEAALEEAFDALGGCDGQANLRDRILPLLDALKDAPQ